MGAEPGREGPSPPPPGRGGSQASDKDFERPRPRPRARDGGGAGGERGGDGGEKRARRGSGEKGLNCTQASDDDFMAARRRGAQVGGSACSTRQLAGCRGAEGAAGTREQLGKADGKADWKKADGKKAAGKKAAGAKAGGEKISHRLAGKECTAADLPAGAVRLQIAGHAVSFPFKPYGSQIVFMERCLRACARGHNALLEAPTGSGKTLALLCSCLAWQRSAWANAQRLPQAGGAPLPAEAAAARGPLSGPAGPGDVASNGAVAGTAPLSKVPQIFFATRTHSQLSQVAAELKRTAYNPTMVILASRNHYCQHPGVTSLRMGASVQEGCAKVRAEPHGCYLNRNVGSVVNLQTNGDLLVHDIEDLVLTARRKRACAYYATHHMLERSDLVLCPYSYIMDPAIRKAMDIDLEGSIVIFDEAHNIEDEAREAASAEVTLKSLSEAHMEFTQAASDGRHTDLFVGLRDALEALISWIEMAARSPRVLQTGFEQFEGVWKDGHVCQALGEAGLSREQVKDLQAMLSKLRSLEEDKEGDDGGSEPVAQLVSPLAPAVISSLLTVLELFHSEDSSGTSSGAHVLVVRRFMRRDARARGQASSQAGPAWEVQFCLWCLDPAVAFRLVSGKARSVLLTSGTLSPLDSFASELGTPFQLSLEAPHVVDMEKRLWAATVPAVGASAVNASFKHANTFGFQDAIGQAVLEICSATPDGVLVFLPSYAMLEKLMARWRSTGCLRDLKRVKKQVLAEPRRSGDEFDMVMDKFYSSIDSGHGALLVAVCRGKVSEGVNFADANARAVVVVGIPYPNFKDLKVTLKKAYNNNRQGLGTAGAVLSGERWYSQQAFRALNQALGRCLRHRSDYGSVILIDERFRNPPVQAGLSRWIRGRLQSLAKLEDGLDGLRAFFARTAAEFPHVRASAPPRRIAARKKGRPLKEKNTNQTTRYSEMKKGPLEVLWSNATRDGNDKSVRPAAQGQSADP